MIVTCRNRNLQILFAALGVLLCPLEAISLDPTKPVGQYKYETWSTDDGLPQNSINSALQTRDGYLWVGTYEGLARFDGVKFRVFNRATTPEMRSNAVARIIEDREGRLWVAFWARGGLVQFKDSRVERVLTTDDGLASNQVWDVSEDHDGIIWVATEQGLNRIVGSTVANPPGLEEIAGLSVTRLLVDRDNVLWIGTDGGGLGKLEDGRLTVYTTSDGLANDRVKALCEDPEGGLWIGTHGGLCHFRDGSFVTYTTADGLPEDYVRALYRDSRGALWIGSFGSRGGVTRFFESRFESFTVADGLTNGYVRCIHEDREGSLWFGTNRGLNQLKDGKFTTFAKRHGLGGEYVRVIIEDQDGGVWIGTDGGGVSRLSNGEIMTFTDAQGLLGNTVRSLAVDNEGAVWVGVFGVGLNRFSEGELSSFTAADNLPSPWIRALTTDRAGDLWIGTEDAGLCRYSDGEFEVHSASRELASPYVSVVLAGAGDRLWVGSPEGLYRLDDDVLTTVELPVGIKSTVVLSLYEDEVGDLWIGTDGGLARLRDGEVTTIGSGLGMFEEAIFQILEGDDSDLWMSTNNGIYRVAKDQLNAVCSGEARRVTLQRYDKADGMISSQCNGNSQPAGWKGSDGTLWFPTTDGAVSIRPGTLLSNTVPPPVVVEELVVDGRSVPLTAAATVEIPPGADRLEVRYTALSLQAPDKVRFRYMMEGMDRDWVDPGGRRTAYYTHVKPGRFRFRVRATNNDGVWSTSEATFNLILGAYFYQTNWFAFGLAFGLVALGFGLNHLRARRYRRQLEQAVGARTGELARAKEAAEAASHAKSQFLANMSHELRTPLNAISGLASLTLKTELSQTQQGYLNQVRASAGLLAQIVDDVLDLARIEAERMVIQTIAFDLDEVLTELSEIVNTEASEKGLEVVFATAPDCPHALVGDPLRLKQVLLNLLKNAIKFTETGEVVLRVDLVTCKPELTALRFSVRDTGVGIPKEQIPRLFESFSQLDESMTRKHGGAGLGLAISKRLVGMMQGEIWVESEVGVGSEFLFTVEFGSPKEVETGTRGLPEQDIRGLRILVVDDNEFARAAFDEMLVSLSFDVSSVGSGFEAIPALVEAERQGKPVRVILVDWKMPGMDGIETALRIKEIGDLSVTPAIILVTGQDLGEAKSCAREAGIDLLLPKPVSMSTLFDSVMEVLGVEGRSAAHEPEETAALKIRFAGGTRVLIVEDNSINMDVAVGLLVNAGLDVETAVNGAEAISSLESGSFDAVLLDVQMPVMDGVEATRVIRANPRFGALPIIAMTAHAMAGDRERFLEAGMNDYVAKPIDEGQLLLVLSRWLEVDEAEEVSERKEPQAEPTFPELPGSDVGEGIRRAGGNQELYRKLVVSFCNQNEGVTQRINDALENGEILLAREMLHTLKGSSATIAAKDVSAAAAATESALRTSSGYGGQLSILDEKLKVVLDGAHVLRRFQPSDDDGGIENATPPDKNELVHLLGELSGFLKENNIEAGTTFNKVKRLLANSLVRDEVEHLERSLDELDFEKAAGFLRDISQRLNLPGA